ncbi:MAG: DUF5916 domain-containing protein [Schleiferiaceae bacterium]|nr:DUF5916 domain-containing protein [Schleiferiaceae bacterium]
MKDLLLVAILTTCTISLYAQTAQDLEVIEWDVPLLPSYVTLDGMIQANEYAGAMALDLSYEVNPGYNSKPALLSTGYAYRTNEALILAFRCEIDPEDFRATMKRRDMAWEDDFIGIALDVYGDTRNMVFIASNAFGVQLDLIKKNPANTRDEFDVSYNITYETWADIQDNYYTVEMRIPFNALQFPNEDLQRWKFSFFRQQYTQGVQVNSQTFYSDNNIPCSDCQMTDVLILDQIQPTMRTEILPYVFSSMNPSDQGVNPQIKLGGSGLIGLNSQTSIEIAINPDFSQVEADVAQVDVNAAFSLLYPERRPFFNEGSDFLESRLKYVYTRAIANPTAIAKGIYQGKDYRTYLLSGWDRGSSYLVSGENRSSYGETKGNWSSVMKIEKPLDNASSVGLLTTHRLHQGGGFGHTVAADANIQIKNGWRIQTEISRTETQEPIADWISDADDFGDYTGKLDGERFNGYAGFFSLRRQRKTMTTRADYMVISPTFRPELGFEPRNNYRRFEIGQSFNGFPNGKHLKRWGTYTEVSHYENFAGVTKENSLMTFGWVSWSNNLNTRFFSKFTQTENYLGQDFSNLFRLGGRISWKPSQTFSMDLGGRGGRAIAYNESTPRIGMNQEIDLAINLQLANKFTLSSSINHASMQEINGSGSIYRGFISQGVANYAFNRFTDIRVIAQYNHFDQSTMIQPLLQYQPSAFTLFYIGGAIQDGDWQGFLKWQRQLSY